MRALTWLIRHTPGRRLPITPLEVAFARKWPTTVRGLILWGVALVVGLKALGYLLTPPPQADQALLLMSEYGVPVWCWASVHLVACLYAIWTAYCHHGRDRYGLTAMAVLCFAWAAVYAATPLTLDGRWSTAYQGALNYGFFMAVVMLTSRYAERPRPDATCAVPAPRGE